MKIGFTGFSLIALFILMGLASGSDEVESMSQNNLLDVAFLVCEMDSNTVARFGLGELEYAKLEAYLIRIQNRASIPFDDVIVSAELSKGMKIESIRYFEEGRGRLDVNQYPERYKDNRKTNISMDIGTMEPSETKTILLEAYIRPCANRTLINGSVSCLASSKVPI
ncbi:MAG: hypothetical protein PHQ34_12515, partial [Methanothrix sp.]|nr:hypothetical protein [Methanothrix sp.]